MNNVVLAGRLTADPKITYGQGDNQYCVARYTLAVERRFKRDGQPNADFISCISFGKNAEFSEKYLRKGIKMIVSGHIQTGSYTNKDGQRVYTTDVVVDGQEFAESKSANQQPDQPEQAEQPTQSQRPVDPRDGFMSISDGLGEEELPFS